MAAPFAPIIGGESEASLKPDSPCLAKGARERRPIRGDLGLKRQDGGETACPAWGWRHEAQMGA
ncbi:MAG: hypothetical protein KAY46_21275, partial [Burkholderiaceae bacterium]|nr:hypothetical protein [Burkholderiaceae bacterium]